jgi:hypothetical protein
LGVPIIAGSFAAERKAKCHPRVRYRTTWMEWDFFEDAPGLGVLHTVCPRCANFGLIQATNKKFIVDEKGRVSVDEPFRCDYCLWRFGVRDGVMSDAVLG